MICQSLHSVNRTKSLVYIKKVASKVKCYIKSSSYTLKFGNVLQCIFRIKLQGTMKLRWLMKISVQLWNTVFLLLLDGDWVLIVFVCSWLTTITSRYFFSLTMDISACWRRLNLVKNYDITNSSKPARLALIQLNILVKKKLTKPTVHYSSQCFVCNP